MAGADGRRPRGLVQLGLAGQRRKTRARTASCPGGRALKEGQHLYTAPDGPKSRFVVAVLEPNRMLVLRGGYAVPRPGFRSAVRSHTASVRGRDLGLPFAAGRPAKRDPAGRPALGAGGLQRLLGLLCSGEPVHFIMQTRQFQNLQTHAGRRRGVTSIGLRSAASQSWLARIAADRALGYGHRSALFATGRGRAANGQQTFESARPPDARAALGLQGARVGLDRRVVGGVALARVDGVGLVSGRGLRHRRGLPAPEPAVCKPAVGRS